MSWHPFKTDAHTEDEACTEGMLQAAIAPKTEHEAIPLDAAPPVRRLTVLLVLELDQIGLWRMRGDGDLAVFQTQLIEDGYLDLPSSCPLGQAECLGDECGGLPLLGFMLDVEGGGDDAAVFVQSCAGVP
ncbi:hypothetical protein BS78_03G310800 [Paspalum vaginatum]|nr:hypothetical protein BS78_03G310800 [Paspalum vaginatum]